MILRSQENVDWSACPLVEVRPDVLNGAPVVCGTRMPAEVIVDNFDYGVDIGKITKQFEIEERVIHEILT